ncbi:MAG TPA: trehalose-phosphatase [Actinocrinis sp.]|nr:trehalose-phosphatase [Actinocrinis sp.]
MDENAPRDAAEMKEAAAGSDAIGALVARTTARLSEYGFFFDFDGTLAPIQQDPESVHPVPGAAKALAALASNAALAAVVSARPVGFLAGRLGGVPGLQLHGLYGLEYSPDGGATVITAPEAEPYAPVIARVVAQAREAFPGALIEDKRLSCALHFRTDPSLEPAIESWAALHAEAHGLRLQHGRMVVELKPPLDTDKGAVVLRAAADLAGAWYFGDDLGDLPAFAALAKLAAEQPGFHAVRVAVGTAEGRGAALGEHADVLLDAPESVPTLLDSLS